MVTKVSTDDDWEVKQPVVLSGKEHHHHFFFSRKWPRIRCRAGVGSSDIIEYHGSLSYRHIKKECSYLTRQDDTAHQIH